MDNKKLFSIGEIASAIGITRRIILNYEDKGLIKPDKKEGETANRYYTIDTFTQIRAIRAFQDLGLSLDEIRTYFEGTSDLRPMLKRLEAMRDELNLTIEKLKERIENRSETVKEITTEPQTIYCRTYDSETVADKTNLLRDTALAAMKTYGTDTTRRMYFTEYSAATPAEVAYCIAIPPESEGEYVLHLPAYKALSFYHHGAYEDIPKTRQKLIAYAEANGIALSGTFRNLYLEGPPQHKDKSKFITHILAIIA